MAGDALLAIGTLLAVIIGLAVGVRGGVLALLIGFTLTCIIAIVQYADGHPFGIFSPAPPWPWGAVSLIGYVMGLAVGIAVTMI